MQRILIANRGEIALRILRTVRAMGLSPIAVFSDADRDAPHVRLSDTAICLGDSDVAASYLNVERLLDAAKLSQADAVIPGYGFLSENAEFADACTAAGLVFIGPPADAIRKMGSKIEARALAIEAGVPLVPGGPAGDLAEARLTAESIGYPLLIKASAGGGGKGMRYVESANQLGSTFERAQSEALRAFGSGRVYLERSISLARHIEVQLLGDQHGTVVALGERECSVQRRHQKVVEECPAPNLSQATRETLHSAALALAHAVRYSSVGTVEFLVDGCENVYFLEMNTRLQVEHTVTELVHGLDLVEAMVRVAQGERLETISLPQPRGWAIQGRVYAEDPILDYQPSVGRISYVREPGGPGIRFDHWLASGAEITRHYDPLLGKLCAYAGTRDLARTRLLAALSELVVAGVSTNQDQLSDVLRCRSFVAGVYHTGLLSQLKEDAEADPLNSDPAAFAALGAALFVSRQAPDASEQPNTSEWVRQHRARILRS